MLTGYRVFCKDHNSLIRGLRFSIKENLQLPEDTECISIKINLRVRIWLIVGLWKLPNQNENYFLQNI